MRLLLPLALLLPLSAATAAGTPLDLAADPSFTWGGLYVGGHVGYGRGRASSSVSDPGPLTWSSSAGSLLGGVQIGYTWRLRSRLLLGLEADLSFPNFLDDNDLVSSRTTGQGRITERLDVLGSVRGRLGYALERWLLYGTGDFA